VSYDAVRACTHALGPNADLSAGLHRENKIHKQKTTNLSRKPTCAGDHAEGAVPVFLVQLKERHLGFEAEHYILKEN
jgi:hypothetical protein